MKIQIQEIEEFEVTDPAGLCNPPAPQLPQLPQTQIQPMPMPMPMNPFTPGTLPSPHNPFRPTPFPIPGIGDVAVPARPTIWTKLHGDPINPFPGQPRWGVGGPMIQQQKDADDPEKWEKNWQSSVGQPVEILRGEDPDGN